MDILDKINEFAKTAADRTSEVIDTARLKAQIMNDTKSIKELEAKIGEHYYKKFAAGELVDEAVMEYCTAISVHKQSIKEKEAALNTERSGAGDFEEEDPFA